MIANGGSYRCGSWWANHLQAPENDRAQVVKSYGLRSENILDMLHEMEAFAKGTRCENYFYQMNLNPLPGEHLTQEQWERAREIAEKHHGLEGQAYFVVEHVKHGRAHQHIVWSRIDLENMRAISDSKDARRNHAIAREIEQEFGLERVTGPYDREPGEPRPKRAPEPWEMYRGMKTGLDPRDISAEVTELFHQSDTGKAFQAALEQHGYILLQGDRRGFVILDSAGKEHSLARRIGGVNTKELNAFMRDVDREALPTIESGKAQYQERKIAALEADRTTVRQEIQWEESLSLAAIEKEKIEGRFVADRAAGNEGQGPSPFEPPKPKSLPHPQLNQTPPESWFSDVAREVGRDTRPLDPPEHIKGTAANIWYAYSHSHDGNMFAATLDEKHGMLLASVTKEEADRSHREAAFAKELGRFAPRYREGEILAVTETAQIYRLNERTTGDSPAGIERFLKGLDRAQMHGIDMTKQVMHERAEAREAYAQLMGIVNPPLPRTKSRDADLVQAALAKAEQGIDKTLDAASQILESPLASGLASSIGKAGRAAGDVAESVGTAIESLFAPTLTPEQKLEGEIASRGRQAEVADQIDFSKYTSEVAFQSQRHEQAGEAARQKERDDRDR